MNSSLTRRKPPSQLRAEAAARTQRWRDLHPGRPDPRAVDRILLQALLLRLVDERIVPREVAAALVASVVEASVEGLRRTGIDPVEARRAVGRRLGAHRGGLTVRDALRDAALRRGDEASRERTA
ncbi:hypothetical protein [Jiella sp. M17.18]|uniref:hypothetical protein n=1 Tax=Jiella sp. M17.18 TaxID=3234247 RepID=UPI0034DE2907